MAIPVFLLARRAPGRVLFSSLAILPQKGRSWRSRFAWVPDALLALAAMALVVALAGPRIGERNSRINREGIAIMMVIDRSGSMANGRLAAARHVLSRMGQRGGARRLS